MALASRFIDGTGNWTVILIAISSNNLAPIWDVKPMKAAAKTDVAPCMGIMGSLTVATTFLNRIKPHRAISYLHVDDFLVACTL